MLPLYLGLAQDFKQLDTSATGMISGAFFLGYNIVTLSAFFWIRKVNWRHISLLAAPFAAVALYAGALTNNYTHFLVATVVAGGALAAIYGIGTTAIGDTSNASRWYGVKIAAEAALGAVLFLVLPGTLIADRGFEGLVLGMIIAMVVLAPLAWRLPARGVKTGIADLELPGPDSAPSAGSNTGIWLSLAGTLLFFAGQTTVWAFVERLGVAGGFPAQTVGNLLSITLLFAVAGSLTCAALGARFGNSWPFAAGCGIYFCALALLSRADQFAFYAAGACMVTYSFGMALPYAVARVAELDSDGRYVVLTVPAIGIGAMLGPSIAGMLTSDDNLTPILWFGGCAVALATLLVLGARNHQAARG
jgi:predicted MFS family arabinose efflux permease